MKDYPDHPLSYAEARRRCMPENHVFPGMEDAVRDIDTDKAIQRISELLELITTGPWKADVNENAGQNWHIASLGASAEDEKVYIVTTDHVPCSEYDGDAKYDAEFIALVRNHISEIIKRVIK